MMRASACQKSETARWANGISLVLAVAIASTPAITTAGTPAEEQGPISTAPTLGPVAAGQPAPPVSPAPATTKPLTTDEQITAFIHSVPPPPWRNDASLAGDIQLRQVHGQMGVSVGTGGYRSAYAQTDIPIGRTGLLSVAVAESRSNPSYGGYSLYGSDPLQSAGGLGYGGFSGHGAHFGSSNGVRQSFGLSLQMGDGEGRGRCRGAANSGPGARAKTGLRHERCADSFDGRPRP